MDYKIKKRGVIIKKKSENIWIKKICLMLIFVGLFIVISSDDVDGGAWSTLSSNCNSGNNCWFPSEGMYSPWVQCSDSAGQQDAVTFQVNSFRWGGTGTYKHRGTGGSSSFYAKGTNTAGTFSITLDDDDEWNCDMDFPSTGDYNSGVAGYRLSAGIFDIGNGYSTYCTAMRNYCSYYNSAGTSYMAGMRNCYDLIEDVSVAPDNSAKECMCANDAQDAGESVNYCDSDNDGGSNSACWKSGYGCCGNGYNEDWCGGSYTACTGGVYRTDGDATSVVCACGGGSWNIGGEVAGTTCCGDDGSEYVTNWQRHTSNSGNTWYVDWTDSDNACCNSGSDCVDDGGNCVSYQGTDTHGSGDDSTVVCHSNGKWLDCDGDSSRCGQCGLPWILTRDGSIGEYNTQGHGSTSCCGDDAGESIRSGGATHDGSGCCSLSTDCIDNGGSCRADGYEYALGNDWYTCAGGTWSDIGCSRSSDCSSGYYCEESSHSCVDLPLCAEANSVYSYNTQENGEDRWNDCADSGWNGCSGSCIKTKSNDGDCAGGSYSCGGASTSTSTNYYCSGGSQYSGTCNSNWYCSSNDNANNAYNDGGFGYQTQGYCDGSGSCDYSGGGYEPDSSSSSCECEVSGTQSTCSNGESNCWDSSAGECCGDDGSGDDWCAGGFTRCQDGTFRTDGDYNSATCECGGGSWNIGGETASTTCCGDDGSEYVTNWQRHTSNSGNTWYVDWTDSDNACCNSGSDCVDDGGNCVSYQGTDTHGSGDDSTVVCHSNGKWLDCDGDSSRCGQCGFPWVLTGDGSIGEYSTQNHGTTSCCGDDAGENYRSGGATHGSNMCCSLSSDCVDSGNTCRASGYNYAYDNDWYTCAGGTWSDIGCSASSDCSSGYYCEESSHTCVDLPTCAEANSGYSYNTQESNEDHWDDCEDSGWNGCSGSCTRTKSNDGYCVGGGYSCGGASTSTSTNYYCSGGSEYSGTCNSNWYCSSNDNANNAYNDGGFGYQTQGYCDGSGSCDYSGGGYEPDSSSSSCECEVSGTQSTCSNGESNCWDSSVSECCGDDGSGDDWCAGGFTRCQDGVFRTGGDSYADVCECGVAGTQGTCNNGETGCWDSSESKCCGDDGSSDDWCAGGFTRCQDGTFRTDGDYNSATCGCGGGVWASSTCCGNDDSSCDIRSGGVCDANVWASGGNCCADSDCNDGNSCTTDTCQSHSCVYTAQADQYQDCGTDEGECVMGEQSRTCTGSGWGDWGSCSDVGPSTEYCDGLDTDCQGDGDSQEGFSQQTTCGVGQCAGTIGLEFCTDDGGWSGDTCNPLEVSTTEVCDGVDDDCDGEVDEGCVWCCDDDDNDGYLGGEGFRQFNRDTDGDGESCSDEGDGCDSGENNCAWYESVCETLNTNYGGGCTILGGYGIYPDCGVECSTDDGRTANQADGDSTTYPGAPELCDGLDNDCSGVDEDWPTLNNECSNGTGACEADGVINCNSAGTGIECTATPGIPDDELCNGVDDDCDGDNDDGEDENWYNEITSCGIGACYNEGSMICQNANQVNTCEEYENTTETCDGLDNDCDGEVDDADEGVCCNANDFNSGGKKLTIKSGSTNLMKMDDDGLILLKGLVSENWNATYFGAAYVIKGGEERLFAVDTSGNLYLKGELYANQTLSSVMDPVKLRFKSGSNDIGLLTTSGDLYLNSCINPLSLS